MKKLVFILSILIATTALFSCRKTGNPHAGLPTEILKDTTSVQFDSTEYNFGTIKQGDKISHIFHFKNTGTKPLIIASAFGSCGCTVPEYPKDPVAPGAEGTVKVTFNSAGKKEHQNKSVTMLCNTIHHQEMIYIIGEVTEPEKK